MRCDEEFVSAIYDGEAVPREAAEHFTHCAACQELFRNFVETGAELRRLGSLQSAEAVPERTWMRRERTIAGCWEKGWQMMKVPRIAFASLILLLLAVGSRLALVEVRAHEDGPVLLLKIGLNDRREFTCPLSATDRRYQQCIGLAVTRDGNVSYFIHFLKKDGDRALLSLRSESGRQSVSADEKQAGAMPETQLWVTAGEASDATLGGVAQAKLTAQWTDHIPVMMGNNEYLDPSANELRLTSPLMLKNNQVVGDLQGGLAFASSPKDVVFLYFPGEGRFTMSMTPINGSVAGKIAMNRISFTSDGQPYVVVTGAPVARGETIWVKRDASYRPPDNMEDEPFLGTAPEGEL